MNTEFACCYIIQTSKLTTELRSTLRGTGFCADGTDVSVTCDSDNQAILCLCYDPNSSTLKSSVLFKSVTKTISHLRCELYNRDLLDDPCFNINVGLTGCT